jgi:hypothetical protein
MTKTLTYIIKLSGECFTESSLAEIQHGFSGFIYTVNAIKICSFAIRIKGIPVKIINDSMPFYKHVRKIYEYKPSS